MGDHAAAAAGIQGAGVDDGGAIGEHRLVYRITGEGDGAVLQIAQCMYHYGRR
jgi:hypothetical protein